MANTIRLKQGTGSDPSASDLVLGEPAVRTDTGEIFLLKDDGSIAKVAGGIDDGDKGDITVSSSGATWTIDSGATQVANKLPLAGGTLDGDIRFNGANSSNYLFWDKSADALTLVNGTITATTFSGSGASLTSLPAGQLTGTVAAARLDTATTQSAGNNSTKVATTAYTDTAISNLINGAPAALDTLNELAAAMNDDAAFSTTVTNSLATKLPLAGGEITGNITCSGSQTFDGRDLSTDGSKLDGIESGATADQSASEILTLIKTVDGSGSGLDADLLDGISSAAFARSDASDTLTGNTYTLSGSADEKIILSGTSSPYIRFQESTTNKAIIQWHSSGYIRLQNQEDASILRIKDDIDFSSDDGSTYHSLYHEGNLSVGDGGLTQNNFTNTLKSKLDGIASSATNVTNNNQLTNGAGYITATLTEEQVEDYVGGMVTGNTETGITVTYQDSDGTLDFVVASQTDFNFSTARKTKLDGIESGATADQSASEILTLIKTVDGSGSGLDADLLDGKTSGSFLDKDGDTADGDITFSGGAGAVTVAANSDIRFPVGNWTGDTTTPKIQGHSAELYICGGTSGIIFRENDTNRWQIDGSGHFIPKANNTYNIGSSSNNVNNCYVKEVYCDGWLRNDASNAGLYNSATGMHWYSGGAGYFDIGGGQSAQGIRCRDNHNGTLRGYLYYNTSNQIGFLDSDGQWAVQVDRDVSVNFRVNGSVEATILPDTVRCEGAFFENNATVAANKTISDGYNAMSAGPITINNSVTVTVGSGEVWTII